MRSEPEAAGGQDVGLASLFIGTFVGDSGCNHSVATLNEYACSPIMFDSTAASYGLIPRAPYYVATTPVGQTDPTVGLVDTDRPESSRIALAVVHRRR